jgi:hypothetical protein
MVLLEMVVPEMVVPEMVVPEMVVPEMVVPEMVVPEMVVPEMVALVEQGRSMPDRATALEMAVQEQARVEMVERVARRFRMLLMKMAEPVANKDRCCAVRMKLLRRIRPAGMAPALRTA